MYYQLFVKKIEFIAECELYVFNMFLLFFVLLCQLLSPCLLCRKKQRFTF